MNPELVEVARENMAADTVTQSVYHVPKSRKSDLLVHLIKEGDWNQILDSSSLQNEIDKDIDKDFIEEANGQAKIETYTVVNSREGPTKGIIIGRLETGKRFIANTRRDKDLLMKMMQNEMLNVQGIVKFEDSRNIFEPS